MKALTHFLDTPKRVLKLRQKSDLLPNMLDNRRNCRLIHMLGDLDAYR